MHAFGKYYQILLTRFIFSGNKRAVAVQAICLLLQQLCSRQLIFSAFM